MTPRNRLALALLVLPLLAACSGLGERPQAVVSTAGPPPPDQQQSRELFVEVVRGLQEQGRWNASLAYLDAYDSLYPGDPVAQVLRGDALSETGMPEEARVLYLGALGTSYAPGAMAGLGFLAASEDRWDEAATWFRDASRLRPTNVRYLNNLGYALLRSGQPQEARRLLQRAYELDTRQPGVRNNLAIALALTGDDASLQALLRSIPDSDERAAVARQIEAWR